MIINWVSPYIENRLLMINKVLLNYYKIKYNDKKFDKIPKSVIVKCKSEQEIDKIVKKWIKPIKTSHTGFDKYILYPLNPDGTRTGGTTFGDVGGNDSDADWNDDAGDDSWN